MTPEPQDGLTDPEFQAVPIPTSAGKISKVRLAERDPQGSLNPLFFRSDSSEGWIEMRSKLAVAVMFPIFGFAQMASAEPIPAGEYRGFGDGAEMSMSITGNEFSISIAAAGCVGYAEGLHRPFSDKIWVARVTDGFEACEITITDDGDHYRIEQGDGCTYFHGASCGFSGQVSK